MGSSGIVSLRGSVCPVPTWGWVQYMRAQWLQCPQHGGQSGSPQRHLLIGVRKKRERKDPASPSTAWGSLEPPKPSRTRGRAGAGPAWPPVPVSRWLFGSAVLEQQHTDTAGRGMRPGHCWAAGWVVALGGRHVARWGSAGSPAGHLVVVLCLHAPEQ